MTNAETTRQLLQEARDFLRLRPDDSLRFLEEVALERIGNHLDEAPVEQAAYLRWCLEETKC